MNMYRTQDSGKTAWLGLTIALLVSAGCQTTPNEPVQANPNQTPQAVDNTLPAAPQESSQAVTPSQDPQPQDPSADSARKILDRYKAQQQGTDQEKRLRSQQHTQEGLQFFNNSDFEKAKRSLDKALEEWPQNEEARQLLDKTNLQLGSNGGWDSISEEAKKNWLARIQQTQIEISVAILDGERFYRAEKYDEALEKLRHAEFRLANFPYELPMKNLLPKTRSLIKEIEFSREKAVKASEEEKRKASLVETQKLAEAQQKEVLMEIRTRLDLAFSAFEQRKYDRTIQFCKEILAIDSHYSVARELLDDATRARHNSERHKFIQKKVDAWKDMMNGQREATIPYSEHIQFPDPKVWNEIKKRADEFIFEIDKTEGDDVEILNIISALEETKLTPNLERATLQEVIDYLRSQMADLNIHADPSISDILKKEDRIAFKSMTPVSAKTLLKTVLSQFGLDYTVRDKTVFITRPETAMGKAYVKVYDLAHVLPRPADFQTEPFSLKPSLNARNNFSNITFSQTTRENSRSYTVDDVKKLVRTMVLPETWDKGKGYSVELTPHNQMVVYHTRAAHEAINKLLDNIKSYAGTMVMVEARFFTADDNFLEDFGVDWRNLPQVAASADMVDGTELGAAPVFPGLTYTAGPGGLFWSEAPGIIIQETARAESFDLRAETYHTWLRRNAAGAPEPVWTVGNRLRNQGGIGMQLQWLGEHQMQAVLRALHKGEKASLLYNPKLMVFNNQRSSMMILTQRAYVQDEDVSAGAIQGALDPIIGIIQDGVVFDVRPVVSHDRKYVTMELRPTLSIFQGFRPSSPFPTAFGTIELPWIVYQKLETTVTCPDKGSIIVGGLKDIIRREVNSDTPFLGNIPILNFLAGRKAKSEEHRHVLIMVTPHVVDLTEHEEQQIQ